jgi:hypothetical protein
MRTYQHHPRYSELFANIRRNLESCLVAWNAPVYRAVDLKWGQAEALLSGEGAFLHGSRWKNGLLPELHLCMLLCSPSSFFTFIHQPMPPKSATRPPARKAAVPQVRRLPADRPKKAKNPLLPTAPVTIAPFEVKRFCRRFSVIRTDLTRLTGYSLRSVDKWASGEKPGKAAQKHLTEMARLFDALAEIMEPDYIGEWLKTPNPAFEGSTPLQVIERGESDRLWRMLYLIESGEPV